MFTNKKKYIFLRFYELAKNFHRPITTTGGDGVKNFLFPLFPCAMLR